MGELNYGYNKGGGEGEIYIGRARGVTQNEPIEFNGQIPTVFRTLTANSGLSITVNANTLDFSANTSDYMGFANYADAGSASSPIEISANTWTDIPTDGLGGSTELDFLPTGITRLANTTTGHIDLSQLALGDTVFVRTSFIVTPSINGANIQFRYLLANGAFNLTKEVAILSNGAGISYPMEFVDYIYIGADSVKDNPIIPQIRSSEDSTFTNLGPAIQVIRRVI